MTITSSDVAGAAGNRALALDFADILLTKRKPREAFETHVVENYIQHNPMAPDGREAAIAMLEGLFASMPEIGFTIHRVLVDGDLAAIHSQMRVHPGDRGVAVVDLLRIENGKIVEHWDVIQAVPEEAANANGMF